jgi:hypothetical protein
MKKTILVVFILFLLGTLALTQSMYKCVRADIPFEFQVHGKTLPAGLYDFRWNRDGIVAVAPATYSPPEHKGIVYVMINSIDDKAGDRAFVTFNQIENSYFLRGINQPGEGRVNLPISAQERTHQKLAQQKVDIQGEVGK